jgi:hypothetical protein
VGCSTRVVIDRGLALGLYLNRGAGIFIGGRGCKASTGLYVQASPVRRCVVGCSTRDVIDRGPAFGLFLICSAGILSAGVVQGQYRPVRAGVSCAAVRCGVHVLSTHRARIATWMVADEHSGCI